MPFAEDRCVIALLFQKACDGETAGSNQAGRIPLHDTSLQTSPPTVASCQQAVSRRRADRGSRMGIGENHSFPGKPVDARRGDFTSIGIEALNVAVSEVITQDHDDVWFIRGRG